MLNLLEFSIVFQPLQLQLVAIVATAAARIQSRLVLVRIKEKEGRENTKDRGVAFVHSIKVDIKDALLVD